MPRWLTLKEGLLALSLLATAPAAAERAVSLGVTPATLIFLALYAVTTAALLAIAYSRRFWVRLLWAILFAAAGLFVAVFESVTGQFLTYDAFITMIASTGDTGNALAQYGRAFVVPALLSALFAAGVLLKPRRPLPFAGLAPAAMVLLLSLLLYARGGEGARGLAPPVTGLSYASLAAYEAASEPRPVRAAVALTPHPAPGADLVFLIDESVAGQYLDLTNSGGVRSGLLQARSGVAVANFGYAASITNCSFGTNLTLRYGGTRSDYRRIDASGPSLFAYAKRAGFHTVYIDAQRPDPARLPLAKDELAGVDETISLARLPVVERDQAAADLVSKRLRDGRRDFILVNKVGAHFPVHDKYPDAYMRYRPALPRGHFLNVSDTGSRAGFGGSPEEWREYRNAYRNTLLWNVGAFFDRLLAPGIGQATILYTSDHGQNLHEDGGAGVNTHCSPDPLPQEGLVPLVVLSGEPGGEAWTRAAALNANRATHYQIFPTLLALMGYDQGEVARLYGPGLDRPVRDPFAFNARFNARLGRGPDWRRIDPGRIARAPANEGGAGH